MDKEGCKIGSIQLSGGKCTIQMKDGPEPFGVLFVCKQMRRAVKTANPRGYAKLIRSYVSDLEYGGLRAIPAVKRKLKTLSADKRKGVQDCCKAWIGWLGQIEMFKNVNSGKKRDQSQRNWNKNFDSIFKHQSKQEIYTPTKIRK